MKSFIRSLAVLVFAISIALGAAPALDATQERTATAGTVTVRVIVRDPSAQPMLPLMNLQAIAQGYVIGATWTNPPTSYSGALIEWYAENVRQGTGAERDWHEYEIHYPPAAFARLSAPMGARYDLRGVALYDGGTTQSVPATASVVVTAPVTLSSSCPTSGYAASMAMRSRYGRSLYERPFVVTMDVPGDGDNLRLGDDPVSWSPQLSGPVAVRVYRLSTATIRDKHRTPVQRYAWTRVPIPQARGSERHDPNLLRPHPTFTDGYPSVVNYPFTMTEAGTYKIEMEAQLTEGFTWNGDRTWRASRIITLNATKFTGKASTPKATGSRRGTKVRFSGSISPRRAATVKVTIQRRLHGKWRSYKSVNVKAKTTGAWTTRQLVKKAGTYRVRAATAGGIADPYREYTAATSGWRTFTLR